MQLPTPLYPGTLIKRYKRFLADISLEDGTIITAHCTNPGSMLGVAITGAPVWVSRHDDKKRKLPYSWELIELDGVLIPINTSNPNKIVAEALEQGKIPELSNYAEHRREVKYAEASRVDFLLSGGGHPEPCYLEVKNVHLSREHGLAEFPDSVTARGKKHLLDLLSMRHQGARAVLLFVIQRMDCTRFQPASDIDPEYGAALSAARTGGVETLCYDCEITTKAVVLRRPVEIEF